VTPTSEDRFLGGRIVARQPIRGFRSGLDAVVVAAAVPADAGDEILELGSGAGVATLCLAARVPPCRILGLEIVPELVEMARANARANQMDSRVHFEEGDALDMQTSMQREFAHVFCNPPFHDEKGQTSPSKERVLALRDDGRFGHWLIAGLKRVRAGGTFTAIMRADRIGEALQALPSQGAVIFPFWPQQGRVAKRAILQIRKNSSSPLALLSGLVLHEESGRYTADADAVLRNGGFLALGSPPL